MVLQYRDQASSDFQGEVPEEREKIVLGIIFSLRLFKYCASMVYCAISIFSLKAKNLEEYIQIVSYIFCLKDDKVHVELREKFPEMVKIVVHVTLYLPVK